MSKNWTWITILIVASAPAVAAHGAPEPREIDARILADQTGNGDYGAGVGGVAPLDEGGLDLLALDVFEGTVPGTTAPAVTFRLIVQGGSADAGPHKITILFTSGDSERTLDLQTADLATYTSETFPIVRGPFDVGDGHPKAIEGTISQAAIGAAPGATLSDIIVRTTFGTSNSDVMPGSWYYAGQEVPLAPGDTAGDPGTWALTGPTAMFTISQGDEVLDPGIAGASASFNVTSTLEDMEQFLSLSVVASSGLTAKLDATTALLAPGVQKTFTLNVTGIRGGDVQILVESDLGVARLIGYALAGGGERGNGGNIESALFGQGKSFIYTFTDPATFEYHCHPHPWMQAKVTIAGDDPTNAPATHIVRILEHDHSDPNSWSFDPAELTIEANDTVVWVNDGVELHTVHGSTGLGVGGHDHDHDHDEPKKDSAGPLLLLPILAALLLRRRE